MIVLIGFAAAALFTLTLWRSGGSLTTAAGSIVLFGALALLGFWAMFQPWVIDLLTDLLRLRDGVGAADPQLVIWGLVLAWMAGIVIVAKPRES